MNNGENITEEQASNAAAEQWDMNAPENTSADAEKQLEDEGWVILEKVDVSTPSGQMEYLDGSLSNGELDFEQTLEEVEAEGDEEKAAYIKRLQKAVESIKGKLNNLDTSGEGGVLGALQGLAESEWASFNDLSGKNADAEVLESVRDRAVMLDDLVLDLRNAMEEKGLEVPDSVKPAEAETE